MRRLQVFLMTTVLMLGCICQANAQITVFDSFGTNNFIGTSQGVGIIGIEDYTLSNPAVNLMTSFVFTGGVANAGEVLDFNFFDSAMNPTQGFAVLLPSGGNFIWTITLGTPFVVPSVGFVEMEFDTTRTQNMGVGAGGTWFIASNDVSIGSSPLDPSALGVGNNYAFAINAIPEPASAGLIGMVLLGGFVSRRRK